MSVFNGMGAVLRNFKTIPCPSGDSCSTPNCQWKHSWDMEAATAQSETTAAPSEVTPTVTTPVTTPVQDNTDRGNPRKRQRVDEAGQAHRPQSGLHSETEISTAKKAVSPPPLKRKTRNQLTETPAKQSSQLGSYPKKGTPVTTTSSHTLTPASSSANHPAASVNPPPPPHQTPKKAPRKPEPLNPRHLKSSPATHEFRFKALRMLHEQLVRLNSELKKNASKEDEKLLLTDQQLIWLALDQEEHVAVDKPPIYSNVIKNRIMSYKRMTVAAWKEERLAEQKKESAAVAAATAATMQTPNTSPLSAPPSGSPVVVTTGLTREQEVAFLQQLLTPISHLAAHRYVPVAPTGEAVEKARLAQEASKGWEVCDRCSTRFQVFPGRRESDGALTGGGACTYHSGRKVRPPRSAFDLAAGTRGIETWACCGEDVGASAGCARSPTHVFKTTDPARLALVLPYAATPPNPAAPADRAVCFDCEMGYTVRGFELIRLTATSWPDGAVLLDVLVQPVGEVLDLNSRYSGITPEEFANAPLHSVPGEEEEDDDDDGSTRATALPRRPPPPVPQPGQPLPKVSSPRAARALLFSLIAPSTPLIGHAIENDLGAVRVIHPTIIDTILLYPHRAGLPMRLGLRHLMREHLNRVVQAGAHGHDSAEDARAAGELVRLRVMKEWERRRALGWRVEGTEFVPPLEGRR